MTTNPHPVGSYFDDIASDYAIRYKKERPYHYYLFHERLIIATRGIDLNSGCILDVGAGTGGLYDFIRENGGNDNYFAIDVSSQMMAQSRIPDARRRVGKLGEVDLPASEFDCIFILGVSSYLPPAELEMVLRKATELLSPAGKLIVSYSNLRGLDWKIRRLIRYFWRGRGVAGQSFETFAYAPSQLALPQGLRQTSSVWYNSTITPFNTLMPRTSVWFGRMMDRYLPLFMKKVIGADIVVQYVLDHDQSRRSLGPGRGDGPASLPETASPNGR